ncbi:MAG: polynucleotide adenylyltransferase PcnB [Planctomycetota bacterium]
MSEVPFSDPPPAPLAHGTPRVVSAKTILPADVNQDALRVLSRLQRNGFEAYLVGGCVRDLLLGRKPKDFDVATAAHPRQIKRLFRNGRIIGRRFRLVHVVYGPHVIETSTFRSDPLAQENSGEPDEEPEDLLITEDNVYGTAAEDARRRDFTVNALFYDPNAKKILDYVDGLSDIEAHVLRTIGPPAKRFAEDPVRILRAIKFATRLGFRIEEETWQALCDASGLLSRSAPPRVAEEILRLLRSGTALGAFRMLRASGALAVLFPEIDNYLGRRDDPDPAAHDRADLYWRLLEALDADIHAGNEPTPAVLLAVLYLRVIEQRAAERGISEDPAAFARVASDVIEPLAGSARLPRRATEGAKRIIASQYRFTQASTKNFRRLLFLRSEDFPEALHLFRLRSAAWGQGWDVYEGWVERYKHARELAPDEVDVQKKKRRRRGGRRRGRGASDGPASPAS